MCPDPEICRATLLCAVVLDDVDTLEQVLLSNVVDMRMHIPESDIAPLVRLVQPETRPAAPDGGGYESNRIDPDARPWPTSSLSNTALTLAARSGSPDAVRLLGRARVPPGDLPTRLLSAAIMSGGTTVVYDACGYRGRFAYPTADVVEALAAVFPAPPQPERLGWLDQGPFAVLRRRAQQLTGARFEMTAAQAERAIANTAEALGVAPDDIVRTAMAAANVPVGTPLADAPVALEAWCALQAPWTTSNRSRWRALSWTPATLPKGRRRA